VKECFVAWALSSCLLHIGLVAGFLLQNPRFLTVSDGFWEDFWERISKVGLYSLSSWPTLFKDLWLMKKLDAVIMVVANPLLWLILFLVFTQVHDFIPCPRNWFCL